MKGLITWCLKILYARAPRPVRSAVRLQLELAARAGWPRLTMAPNGRRILVLAPHMDDEVFGCGGTLAQAIRGGAQVAVIYLTDGRKSHAKRFASLTGQALADAESALVERRKHEAHRAARLLGIDRTIFLDFPDGALAITPTSVTHLAEAIAGAAPECVFLPFLSDTHPDHWVTNGLWLAAAARARVDPELPCWGYEVWTPLVASCLVDITPTIELKRDAMAEFASQLELYDYSRAMQHLNAYRGILLEPAGRYAEAFYVAPLEVYRALYEMIVTSHGRAARTVRDAGVAHIAA
jgi:N-acetylglucosamine malate deacetylase 1